MTNHYPDKPAEYITVRLIIASRLLAGMMPRAPQQGCSDKQANFLAKQALKLADALLEADAHG